MKSATAWTFPARDAHSIAIVPPHFYELPAYLRAQGFAAKQPPVVWMHGTMINFPERPSLNQELIKTNTKIMYWLFVTIVALAMFTWLVLPAAR